MRPPRSGLTPRPEPKPTSRPRSAGLTGRHVLFAFLGFFSVIASADAFLVVSAVKTWSGAETSSAYRAGQLYNQEIAEARAQAARGWHVEAAAERASDGTTLVRVDARDREGRALAGLSLAATLQRPTHKREDRSLRLSEAAAGVYSGTVAGLAPGQWDLVVEAEDGGGRTYRRMTRLVLR